MNSLLYQRLREELQIIYDVSMFYESYKNQATLILQLSYEKDKAELVSKEIENLHKYLKNKTLEEKAFLYLKEKVKNQFILEYAHEASRLILSMRGYLIYDKEYTLDYILNALDRLNLDHFNKILHERFSNQKHRVFSLK